MDKENNLKENIQNVNNNVEFDLKLKQLREELAKRFSDYKNAIRYFEADAPIAVLCLPAQIENILLAHGLLRVYDLFDVDFSEIKGLGEVRMNYLTARINEFFSVL